MTREQRKRLETIEDELEEVKRKLGRIWHFIETSDAVMTDASGRIREGFAPKVPVVPKVGILFQNSGIIYSGDSVICLDSRVLRRLMTCCALVIVSRDS